MVTGTIIKGYSGFYYVAVGEKLYECSLRGKNRLKNDAFLPGDRVEIQIVGEEKGVIESVLKRKNVLLRPPMANIDQLVIVSGMKDPVPDFMLVDRLTVFARYQHIEAVLVFNKADLARKEDMPEILERYRETGFPVYFISTLEENAKGVLQNIFAGKISIVAGISGAGKTSIVNLLKEGHDLPVGKISAKLKRGRHTTRHTELIPIGPGSWIADSPGFSSLHFPKNFSPVMVTHAFPEFRKYFCI